MTQKLLTVVMSKEISLPKDNSDYALSKAIDKFLYETGGCIVGWDKHIDTPPLTNGFISYTCTIEDQIDNRSDLSDYLDKIKADHAIEIIDNLNTSSTITVHFES